MYIYLLQAGSGSSGGGMFGGGTTTLVFMGMIILVFWLFFIRPQTKKQKDQKKFIEDLQRGTKVVTIAGIHDTVNKVNEDGTINLEVSPGSYIKTVSYTHLRAHETPEH